MKLQRLNCEVKKTPVPLIDAKVVEGWAKQEPRLGRSLADSIQPLTAGEVPVAIGYIKDKFQYPGPIEYVRMNKYLASLSFVAINRQAPHPNAARLFADYFLGAESQRIFGNFGEYVFHPEADHKFKRDVKDDQIIVMRLAFQRRTRELEQKVPRDVQVSMWRRPTFDAWSDAPPVAPQVCWGLVTDAQ